QQHRVVFVHGVVAVLHEHAAPVAELHRDRDAAARAETVNVFSPALRWRHVCGASISREHLSFLEVDVNRMIPATPLVDEMPDFPRTEPRCRRDAAVVRIELLTAIGPDSPRSDEGRVGAGPSRLAAILSEHER